MKSALIIEDRPSDVRNATNLLKTLGATQIDVVSAAPMAVLRLEEVVAGTRPAPDVIILDLELGIDSGFEVLRFWKTNRKELHGTRIVVWSIMGDREREIVGHFGAEFVSKSGGVSELKRALKTPNAASGS